MKQTDTGTARAETAESTGRAKPSDTTPTGMGAASRGSTAVDGLDDQAALSPGQVAKQIYAFFYNKTVGLVLILLAGLLGLMGAILPQMPASTAGDAQATEQWLEQVRPAFGGWTGILHTLGAFNMFTSVPFLVVMGLLAASILACTAHRLPVIWRASRHPRTRVTARFFERARLRSHFTAPVSTEKAFETVCVDARRHHLRVIVDERGPGHNAYLDRNHWAPFGTVLAHLAFVVVMAGFVVSS
ncbi:cytochrome c biogenesis protein ResB [Actinomyces ruminis]|uniref:cytochrome c biogenesis protein ResB n=1 Tax=Actinomyces ruminis TaxID=1937003 RepID=UPI00211E1BA5|nr:cytochrome c biogenesis protein ResB [Actinomyces ruminis]